MKHPSSVAVLCEEAERFGLRLPRERARLLLGLEDLLVERAVPLGLVAEGDIGRIRTRHTLDCLRAVLAVRPEDRAAADLGTGAGLPGLVVAIAVPGLAVSLVDVRRRKVAFVEMATRALRLNNVDVYHGRGEDLRGPFDLCLARAFAPLAATWRVAQPLLAPTGRLVYFAGRGFRGPGGIPEDASWSVLETPVLESAGALVIMARQ